MDTSPLSSLGCDPEPAIEAMVSAPRAFWWRYPASKLPPPSIEGLERLLIALTQMVRTVLDGQTTLQTAVEGIRNITMTTQEQVDAITTSVQGLITAQGVLSGHVDTVDTELQAFIAANPTVDVSALAAAVATAQASDDAIDTHVQAIGAVLGPPPVTP